MKNMRKKKLILAVITLLVQIHSQLAQADFIAGALDGSIAIGMDAGFSTYARCIDGTPLITADSTACDARGGWFGSPVINPLTGTYHLSTGFPNLAPQSTSIGFKSLAAGDHSFAGGVESLAYGNGSSAVGIYATALANYSLALGFKSRAIADSSVAIGMDSFAENGSENYTIGAQMNGAQSASASEVSFGDRTTATYRRLTNVADGYANHDAVNVQQLNSGVTNANNFATAQVGALGAKTGSALNSVAASFGGGSIYDPVTGAFTQPTYTVGGATYNNVGSALSGVAANNDNLGNTTAAAIGGGATYNPATGAISAPTINAAGGTYTNTASAIQALDKSAVQYDKTATGTVDNSNVTLLGATGTTVHNVAAGVASNDAVNVGQLNNGVNTAINTSNTYTDNKAVTTLNSANTYTDNTAKTTLNQANTYTDSVATATLNDANTHTDNTARTTLNQANTYTDSVATATLNDANTHTDNAARTTLNQANTYTDRQVNVLGKSAVQYDTVNGVVDNSSITLQGVNGTVIHNVADGVAPTDVANVGQVERQAQTAQDNAINAANRYTDSQIGNLSTSTQAQIAMLSNKNQAQFDKLNGQIKATGSIASAMSALVPNPQSTKNLQAQAAVGYGNGAAAIGAGATYQVNPDILLVGKMAVSTASGVGATNRIGGAVGVSFGL